MRKIYCLFGALTLITSNFVYAEDLVTASPNWSGVVKITSIEVSEVNIPGVWVTFNPSPYPNTACPNKAQYALFGSALNIERMLSLANESMLRGRSVRAYSDSYCYFGYPVLRGLTFY